MVNFLLMKDDKDDTDCTDNPDKCKFVYAGRTANEDAVGGEIEAEIGVFLAIAGVFVA
jgi:hypothetical protein